MRPIFSHRFFAKKAGFTSPSFLNHVMKGARNLTPSSLDKLIRALGLKGKMAAYLKVLVLFNQSKTTTERLQLYEDLVKLRHRFTANQLESESFSYFDNWYNPVIRELVAHADWNGNFKTLGSLLIPPISSEKAMKVVENLVRMKLIKKKSQHLYLQASQAVLADQAPLAGAILLFCSCVLSGGGTEDPSSSHEICGVIDSKLTSQLAGAKVRLSRVSWNSKVNTTMIVDSTLTDNLGHFNFKLKDGGAYSILAEKDDSLAALSNSFEAKPDSGIKINLKLKKRSHLKERVILPFGIPIASIRIFIVGHSNVTSPDSEGVYELPNLPQGKYSIVFSTDLLTNYLPIDFKDEADDDVFIEDVAVNEIPDSLTEDLPPPAGNSSDDKLDEVDPVQYPLGQEPSWYKDKLFNEVIYLDSNRTRQTIHCEVVAAWNPICL